jgi:8-oxo-dGTP pyrophosphatase MutT (NUDIX family)
MATSLVDRLDQWQAARRFGWVLLLGIVSLVLPTCLTIYGEVVHSKTPQGWIWVGTGGTLVPVLTFLLVRHLKICMAANGVATTLLREGVSPRALLDGQTDDEFRRDISDVLCHVPLDRQQAFTVADVTSGVAADRAAVAGIQARVLLEFFQALGLLNKKNHTGFTPASDHAGALLRVMGAGLRCQVPFYTNWRASDVEDPAFRKAHDLISAAEDQRRAGTRDADWQPVRREVPASLILIKALRNGREEVLIRWSASWQNHNWVGGLREEQDKSAEDCAWRELYEELGVERAGNLSLSRVGDVGAGPIKSQRLGIYSTWRYDVFALNARSFDRQSLPPTLARVLSPKAAFDLFTTGAKHTVVEWAAWSEIKAISDFAGYGPEVSKFIQDRFTTILPSFSFDLG